MKRIIAVLSVAALLLGCFSVSNGVAEPSSYSEGMSNAGTNMGQTVEDDLEETMESAQEAYDTAAETTYEEMVPQPEDIQKQASKCLDGILNADFGFGLNVPSVSDLLGAACDKINSEVKGYLRKKSETLRREEMKGLIEGEMGIAFGGKNAPVNQIDYEQQGKEISNEVWQDISEEKEWLK